MEPWDNATQQKRLKIKIYAASINAAATQVIPALMKEAKATGVIVSSHESFRKIFQDRGKVTFPIMGVRINRVAKNTGFNERALEVYGVRGGKSEDGRFFINYKVKPVLVELNVSFITDQINHLMEFTENYHIFRKERTWFMELDDIKIQCNILMNGEIVYPEKEFGEEFGDLFRMDTTFMMSTWVGFCEKVPVIREMNMNTKLINAYNEDNTLVIEDVSSFTVSNPEWGD